MSQFVSESKQPSGKRDRKGIKQRRFAGSVDADNKIEPRMKRKLPVLKSFEIFDVQAINAHGGHLAYWILFRELTVVRSPPP
jgi:hypothetical protein